MFKRLFVFLLATFSVQSPIFAEGCKKFLESQGYVRSKVKGVIVKDVWYAFDEEFMNDESEFAPCEGILKGSTAMCKTTTLYPAESASWNKCILKNNRKLPFQGGETWCNGKLFHYGDLTYGMDPTVITFGGGENVGAGFFYDKNENKWPVTWKNKEKAYKTSTGECRLSPQQFYFDTNTPLYFHRQEIFFKALINNFNKYIFISYDAYVYFEKGVKPSF